MILTGFKRLPFSMTPEKREEISKRVAQRIAERMDKAVKMILDGNFPTMRDMPPDQRLLTYVQMTVPNDFQLLLIPDYLELQRQGLLPVLESPRWQEMMSIPDLFTEVRADFLNLYRSKVEDI